MSTIITHRQFPNYHKYEMELAGRPLCPTDISPHCGESPINLYFPQWKAVRSGKS